MANGPNSNLPTVCIWPFGNLPFGPLFPGLWYPADAVHLIDSLNPADLLLIVVGAHPRAESADRPIAYWLLDRVRERQAALAGVGGGAADVADSLVETDGGGWGEPVTGKRRPLVCSDVWFLNDDSLRQCPVISVGGPRVNALSAYLGDKLPGALVVDGVFMVQLDVEFTERSVCCWGESAEGTCRAVELFCERYLDGFLMTAGG